MERLTDDLLRRLVLTSANGRDLNRLLVLLKLKCLNRTMNTLVDHFKSAKKTLDVHSDDDGRDTFSLGRRKYHDRAIFEKAVAFCVSKMKRVTVLRYALLVDVCCQTLLESENIVLKWLWYPSSTRVLSVSIVNQLIARHSATLRQLWWLTAAGVASVTGELRARRVRMYVTPSLDHGGWKRGDGGISGALECMANSGATVDSLVIDTDHGVDDGVFDRLLNSLAVRKLQWRIREFVDRPGADTSSIQWLHRACAAHRCYPSITSLSLTLTERQPSMGQFQRVPSLIRRVFPSLAALKLARRNDLTEKQAVTLIASCFKELKAVHVTLRLSIPKSASHALMGGKEELLDWARKKIPDLSHSSLAVGWLKAPIVKLISANGTGEAEIRYE